MCSGFHWYLLWIALLRSSSKRWTTVWRNSDSGRGMGNIREEINEGWTLHIPFWGKYEHFLKKTFPIDRSRHVWDGLFTVNPKWRHSQYFESLEEFRKYSENPCFITFLMKFFLQAPPGKSVQFELLKVEGLCNYGCYGDRVEFRVDRERLVTGYRWENMLNSHDDLKDSFRKDSYAALYVVVVNKERNWSLSDQSSYSERGLFSGTVVLSIVLVNSHLFPLLLLSLSKQPKTPLLFNSYIEQCNLFINLSTVLSIVIY